MTEWLSEMNLTLLNRGGHPTFIRYNQQSYIDITLCTEGAARNVTSWRVSDEETFGWHQAIEFEYRERTRQATRIAVWGWRTNETTLDRFREILTERTKMETRLCYREYLKIVTDCCDAAFPNKTAPQGRRKEVYWWCPGVRDKRRECRRRSRRMTRENKDGSEESKAAAKKEYKISKRDYNREILRSMRRSWQNIIKDLDRDEWGQGYRMVVKRTNLRRQGRMSHGQQMAVARKLFPAVRDDVGGRIATAEGARPSTSDELLWSVRRIKNGKAPGLDGILPEIAKVAVSSGENMFLDMANEALKKRTFPEGMKEAKLVLLPKPAKKTKGDAAAYRPISLLGAFGKILEGMVAERINEELRTKGELNERQYGFRAGRSTIGAMEEVMEIVRSATRTAAQHKKFCALVAVDIKNAFNTARWSGILEEMGKRGIGDHLVELVRSYLTGRTLVVGEGHRMNLTCGVPQGSVLGPLLWNIFYDGVLDLRMPEGITIIGYADDLALVAVGKSAKELVSRIDTAMIYLTEWLQDKKLNMAPEKTEVVLLSGRRKVPEITIRVGEKEIKSRKSIKYLGVHFDKDMRMTEHVRQAAARANEVTAKLAILMPNIGGPRASKRRVISGAASSVLLYGAPIWGGVMRHGKYRNMVGSVQRKLALRIGSAYRTVSLEAAQVIAGLIPIDLKIRERMKAHGSNTETKEQIRAQIIKEWQDRWSGTQEKAEWTRTLIKDVQRWTDRRHGEINYHLSQFLTGHGSFASYLYKIRKAETATCTYCNQAEDTARHTFYECGRWEEGRKRVATEMGGEFTPEKTIAAMIEKKETWDVVNNYVVETIRRKEEDERRMSAQGR